MEHNLNQFIEVCKKLGGRADLFQGGGGNVSLKISETEMLIKASGYRISDITHDNALVTVTHQPIKAFYGSYDSTEDRAALIANNKEIVSANTLRNEIQNEKPNRPSMEVGFHSLLGRTVIHSHSVYTNILTCTVEGPEIIKKLFPKAAIIPYDIPGAPLTLAIRDVMSADNDVLFLLNHGLIVSTDTPDDAYKLHESTNETIRDFLKLSSPYPQVGISETETGVYVSTSPYLKEAFLEQTDLPPVENTLLFPDQAVYIDPISYTDDASAVSIIDGTIRYTNNYTEALAREETLVAWAFIVREANRAGLNLRTLTESDRTNITGLESEKYRKQIR